MGQTIGKVIGAIIVIALWTLIEQSSLPYLFDWSTAELVGYNVWTLITLGIAIYIVYRIFKYKKKTTSGETN